MSEPKQPASPVSDVPEKFYLTTPIYYVNARPHIGHAYSTIVADVLARRHRLLGHDTFFLTGTDEHGQKIERSAAAAGIPPLQFADQNSKTFSDLWQRMGITNDAFIRTTEPRHKRGVQKLFENLYDHGHIYLSTYTGQYSIGEEMFVDGPPGTIGPDGRPTETVTEENFFFRLSDFQEPLLDLIESNLLKITPESSRNEVLSFVRGNLVGAAASSHIGYMETSEQGLNANEIDYALSRGRIRRSKAGFLYVPEALKDLSVSRSSFTWGIPVPEAVQQDARATQKHVIYVWLDALANYMTAIGYGSEAEADQKQFTRYWPADLHLVGKEITRFHCVYWPAFLLAAGLPTPKQVTANGWLLFHNAKMSKSKGNVVRTETILDAFGEHVYKKQFPDSTEAEQDLFATDVLRYFLLREIPFGQDGTFSFDSMVTRYNADLTNGYGNLVSRTLNLLIQNFGTSNVEGKDARYAQMASYTEDEETNLQWDQAKAFSEVIPVLALELIDSLSGSPSTDFNGDLQRLVEFLKAIDGFISEHEPWKIAKRIKQEQEKIYRHETSEQTEERIGSLVRRLSFTLYTAAEAIRIATILLSPILPHSTARVFEQLGLKQLESNPSSLQWGILPFNTRFSQPEHIFPKAEESLAILMEDLEAANAPKPEKTSTMPTEDTSQQPAEPATHPAEPLKEQGDPITPTEPQEDSTHPAAPPRTSSQETSSPGAMVAGSHAITTEREGTPSHTEAQASGIFAAQPVPDTPQIAIDDFTKVDLRVAKILVAERIPKADKLLRLEVDLGYEQRQILSGIAEHYGPEELIGRKIVIIANLAPRKMRGLESRGMLLAASEGEDGKPILATFGEEIAVGTRLR